MAGGCSSNSPSSMNTLVPPSINFATRSLRIAIVISIGPIVPASMFALMISAWGLSSPRPISSRRTSPVLMCERLEFLREEAALCAFA